MDLTDTVVEAEDDRGHDGDMAALSDAFGTWSGRRIWWLYMMAWRRRLEVEGNPREWVDKERILKGG